MSRLTQVSNSITTYQTIIEQLYRIRQHFMTVQTPAVLYNNQHNDTRQAGKSYRIFDKGKQGRCRIWDFTVTGLCRILYNSSNISKHYRYCLLYWHHFTSGVPDGFAENGNHHLNRKKIKSQKHNNSRFEISHQRWVSANQRPVSRSCDHSGPIRSWSWVMTSLRPLPDSLIANLSIK